MSDTSKYSDVDTTDDSESDDGLSVTDSSIDDSFTFEAGAKDLFDRIEELPRELEDAIMDFAGETTKFLHGRLPLPLTLQQAQFITAELIKHDAVDSVQRMYPGLAPVWESLLHTSPQMLSAIVSHFVLSDTFKYAVQSPAVLVKGICTLIERDLLAKGSEVLVPLINEAVDVLVSLAPASKFDLVKICRIAVVLNRIDLLKLFLPLLDEVVEDPSLLHLAIAKNHTDIWEYMLLNADEIQLDVCAVFEHDNIDACRMLHARFPNLIKKCHPYMLASSVSNASRETIMWLLSIVEPQHESLSELRNFAAVFGRWDLLKYYEDNNIGAPLNDKAFFDSALDGKLDSVIELHKRGYRHDDALDAAAREGCLEIIKWLHENGYTSNGRAIENSTKSVSYEATKYLIENRLGTCTAEAFLNVVDIGYLELFQMMWDSFPNKRPSVTQMLKLAHRRHLAIFEFYLEQIKADSWIAIQFVQAMQKDDHDGEAVCIAQRFCKDMSSPLMLFVMNIPYIMSAVCTLMMLHMIWVFMTQTYR